MAGALVDIDEVDARRFHPHQRLTLGGLGRGELVELEDFGTAGRVDANGFHARVSSHARAQTSSRAPRRWDLVAVVVEPAAASQLSLLPLPAEVLAVADFAGPLAVETGRLHAR